jgi:SAM-dependent methyltransferase
LDRPVLAKARRPSFLAVASAREDVKPYMIASMMDDSVLPNESFQMGVMFHTLDHLQDPVKTLTQCLGVLESGGVFIVAVHNVRSWSARLFGERSPIIDIEHTHLYSRNTGAKIFQKVGFEQIRTGSYMNHYTLAYIFHLLPISQSFKRLVLASPTGRLLSKIKVVLPLGNMWIAGIKP